MPLTQIEQRMAFYAKILKNGQLMLNEEDAEEWRRDLPAAIRGQHLLLPTGHRAMTTHRPSRRPLSARPRMAPPVKPLLR